MYVDKATLFILQHDVTECLLVLRPMLGRQRTQVQPLPSGASCSGWLARALGKAGSAQ